MSPHIMPSAPTYWCRENKTNMPCDEGGKASSMCSAFSEVHSHTVLRSGVT